MEEEDGEEGRGMGRMALGGSLDRCWRARHRCIFLVQPSMRLLRVLTWYYISVDRFHRRGFLSGAMLDPATSPTRLYIVPFLDQHVLPLISK